MTPIKLYIEIDGGCLQCVYGDKMPEGYRLEVILRDHDNIEAGDEDPLPDDEARDQLVHYW